MSIFPLTTLKTIFLSEFILVFAMAIGIAPQEFSYLILVLLVASFVKLNMLDSLKLFILSIPFFVALPANAFSDSMSIWRVLIIALFLKAGWEKESWLHSSEKLWNRCARLLDYAKRLHSPKGTMEPTYLQKCSTALKGLWSKQLSQITIASTIGTKSPK